MRMADVSYPADVGMLAQARCGSIGSFELGDHSSGEHEAKLLAPTLRLVVARPAPRSVLDSTQAPTFSALIPLEAALRTNHTTRVVVAYGDVTRREKAICVNGAALPGL